MHADTKTVHPIVIFSNQIFTTSHILHSMPTRINTTPKDKLAAFRPFRQAFVAAHQDRCPDMWQMGDQDPEGTEAIDGPASSDEAVLAAPVIPPSTEATQGHSKVTAVIISTLFMDAWARGGTDLDEGGDTPSLSPR